MHKASRSIQFFFMPNTIAFECFIMYWYEGMNPHIVSVQ